MKIYNLQNVPREKRIKRLFIPNNEDEVLLEGDLSQAEGMVVAWYAQEKTLMEKYLRGEDVHSFVGTIVLEKKITKENKQERDMAKRIVHGANYGMKPMKIGEILLNEMGIVEEPKKLQRAQNIYFQNFPRIKTNFHGGIQNELRTQLRVIKTPVGFERKFYTPWGDSLFREAYAFYPQNIVAYITNQALVKIWGMGEGDRVLAQGHDAILMSVLRERLKEYVKILEHSIKYTINIKGTPLTIPVEFKAGENWGDMKEVKSE